jgi:hypothetical protein
VEDIKLPPLLNHEAGMANRRLPGPIRHNRSNFGSARRSFRIAEIRVAEVDRGRAALLPHVLVAVVAAEAMVAVAPQAIAVVAGTAVVADAIS